MSRKHRPHCAVWMGSEEDCNCDNPGIGDTARMDFLELHYCGVDFDHPDFGAVMLIRIPKGGRVGPGLRLTVDGLTVIPV